MNHYTSIIERLMELMDQAIEVGHDPIAIRFNHASLPRYRSESHRRFPSYVQAKLDSMTLVLETSPIKTLAVDAISLCEAMQPMVCIEAADSNGRRYYYGDSWDVANS